MNPKDFTDDAPGHLITISSLKGENVSAFLPDPLPPEIRDEHSLTKLVQSAALAVGALQHLGKRLPNPYLFLRPFISREAIASSRIEGTRTDYEQLALIDRDSESPIADADLQEVVNYVDALLLGWSYIEDREFSVSLFLELHRKLMTGARGSDKRPGELRVDQVYIGQGNQGIESARFIPPPPLEIRPLLDDLCNYLSIEDSHVELIRLAFFHYQFETIHPFTDGNGRLGRLLMPLLLMKWGMISHPMLYLSEYFERRREEYIDLLYRVSTRGEWIPWVSFVLKAIEAQATDAYERGEYLLAYRDQLRSRYVVGRAGAIYSIIDSLFEQPSITVTRAAAAANVSYQAARTSIATLVSDGMLVEMTQQRRNRVFFAPSIYRAILGIETDS